MTVDPIPAIVPPPTFLAKVHSLLHRRATWVLIDQAIVSAGNFFTANLLLRHLPEAQFGAYNVLLETLNYLLGLQAALIIYPLTIKGATGEAWGLGQLTTGASRLTYGLFPLLAGATLVALGFLEGGPAMHVAIAAMLLWQLQETTRRALMSQMRFADAVWGDAVRYLGQVVIIFWLARARYLDLNMAFIAMCFTTAVAFLIQGAQVGLSHVRVWQLRLMVRDFWRLGRWMLLSNGAGIITALGYWWTLQWAHGEKVVAVFGAVVLPFKLANPIMSSMSGLIMPAVARSAAADGFKASTRTAMKYIALGAVLLLPYFMVLILIPRPMLILFCKVNSPYLRYTVELQMFVVNYFIVFVGTMVGAWLAGLGRARLNFYAQAINIVATLAIGLPMTATYGVRGLIIGGMISSGICLLVSIYLLYRVNRAAIHVA